jgi:hypothetical protein
LLVPTGITQESYYIEKIVSGAIGIRRMSLIVDYETKREAFSSAGHTRSKNTGVVE